MTFIFLIIAIPLAMIFYVKHSYKYSSNIPNIIIQKPPKVQLPPPPRPPSVLLNPYTPPLRDTTFFSGNRGIPINIRTQSFDTAYRQVGILTRINGTETILPIMGRPLHANRNKWQYYTMSDQNNSIKLPINRNGRSCTNEYGCDCLFNGDSVYVEGYNDAFKVTMYDNAVQRYIPFI